MHCYVSHLFHILEIGVHSRIYSTFSCNCCILFVSYKRDRNTFSFVTTFFKVTDIVIFV